jgi:hypothetical protein
VSITLGLHDPPRNPRIPDGNARRRRRHDRGPRNRDWPRLEAENLRPVAIELRIEDRGPDSEDSEPPVRIIGTMAPTTFTSTTAGHS